MALEIPTGLAGLQLSVQSVLVGAPRRGAGVGHGARAYKTDLFLKPELDNLQSMHFLHRCHGLIGYNLYLVRESGFESRPCHILLHEPGSCLCPGGLSDAPAALAHRVGHIMVRNPLHGTLLFSSAL